MKRTGNLLHSNILKFAILATGLSGIVAEYVLATMANYFLGDSVTQWALIISIMLFSMGVGSRISRVFNKHLLETFIYIEFSLSIVVSLASMLVYAASKHFAYQGIIIYAQCVLTGLLIGMEIPLVTRINEAYQELRENISAVLTLDYVGSLVGGLLFAFVCVPFIGLTYTPFIFGAVNLSVAVLLYWFLRSLVAKKHALILKSYLGFTAVFILVALYFAEPITMWGHQASYTDRIVYEKQSKYQHIVLTQWKNHYWLYLNNHQQLSTFDEWHYHEPLVHPIMKLARDRKDVLVMGGGDGCVARDVFKHKGVQSLTLIDLDSVVTNLGKHHEAFLSWNEGALNDPRVNIQNSDGLTWLRKSDNFYDVIIIDLPDPRNVDINKLYTKEFYQLCYQHLRPNGYIITQSGSPYFATRAFNCITKTMESANFAVVPMHHHVLSLGEWGWNIACKNASREQLKSKLQSLKFDDITTRWINNEAMMLLTSFGQDYLPSHDEEINTLSNPVLYRYYLDGNWKVY